MTRKRLRRITCAVALAAAGAVFPEAAEAQVSTVSGGAGNDQIIQGQIKKIVAPIMKDTIRQTTGAVQKRVGSFVSRLGAGGAAQQSGLPSNGATGLAAGDSGFAQGVWGDVSSSHLSNTNTAAGVSGSGQQEGTSNVFTLGLDGQLGDWVVGAAASLNITDLDLYWVNGTSKTHGVTLTPYVGYTIDDIWSIDAQASYTRSSYDLGLSNATADFDSDRFLIAANANAFKAFDNWKLTGTAGLLYARENVRHFNMSVAGGPSTRISTGAVELGQFKLGFEVGYAIGPWEPYIGTQLEADFINDTDDNVGAVYKGGFRYNFGGATTAGLEMSTVQHRSDEENYTIGANFRVQF